MQQEVMGMSGKLIKDYAIVGNLVFTSGMTGEPGDVKAQIEKTLDKLRKALEEAGTSFENVVKGTVYLADLKDRERYLNDLWRKSFLKNPPARTCVQAGLAPGTAVEIELVAMIPKSRLAGEL